MELRDKQIRFCQEYVLDSNATQAAIRAGYSKVTARLTGSRLLAKAPVKDYINELQVATGARLQVNRDMVVQELAAIAFSTLHDYMAGGVQLSDLNGISRKHFKAISTITLTETEWEGGCKKQAKIKLYDKVSALEKLARILGAFDTEREEEMNAPEIITIKGRSFE